jgi:hypothetical protein
MSSTNEGKVYPVASADQMPEYPEAEVVGRPTGSGLENDVAFSKFVKEILETPDEGLKRCLAPGEIVLEEFEVYFPDHFTPNWKKILYSILTLGVFACILLYRHCKRNRWCCLVPDEVHMVRGKMAVTNKGRAICWTLSADQFKDEGSFLMAIFSKCCCCIKIFTSCFSYCFCRDMCEPPFTFDVTINTREFLLKDVRQITQWYENENPCPIAGSCCRSFSEYQCGVDLSFHCFHNVGDFLGEFADIPSAATVSSVTSWVQMVSAMSGYLVGSFSEDLSSSTGIVRVISATSDKVNHGDPRKPMETVSALQARLLNLLPPTPDVFFMDSNLEAELQKNCSCKVVDNVPDIQIVDAGGKVQIPRKYVPLLPGERVIAGHGMVYMMNCEDWLKAVFTFGIYYLWYIRRKKESRSAVVLTTKRILVLDIKQLGGRIPDSMMKFSVVIRSLLPGAIRAGYIEGYSTISLSEVIWSYCFRCLVMALQEAQRVRASIMCDAGSFTADFSQSGGGLEFAKAMQMATTRSKAKVDMTVSRAQDADTCISKQDKTFIPLTATEIVFARHAGYNKYQPCCDVSGVRAWLQGLVCRVRNGVQSAVYLCSSKAMCLFPFCPMVFTCGLRPFMMKTDYIITDHTIYYISSKLTEPWITFPVNENGFFVGKSVCVNVAFCSGCIIFVLTS